MTLFIHTETDAWEDLTVWHRTIQKAGKIPPAGFQTMCH